MRHYLILILLEFLCACGPRTAAPVDREARVASDAAVAAAPAPMHDAAPDECLAAAGHVVDVLVAEADPAGTGGVRERVEQARPELVAECHEHWTASQIECVRGAVSYAQINRCFTI